MNLPAFILKSIKNKDSLSLYREFVSLALNGTVQDFTKNGKCSQCGECCSNLLPLSESEVQRIKLFIIEHSIQPQPLIRGQYIYAGICPFLDVHKKCLIYDVRPLICKAFKCNRKAPSNKFIKLFLLEERPCLDVRETFFHEEAQHDEAK